MCKLHVDYTYWRQRANRSHADPLRRKRYLIRAPSQSPPFVSAPHGHHCDAMAARLIVDGNNVIGSRPDGWWRDRAGATRALVERLAAWADEEVIVVFDGKRPADLPEPPNIEVRFAERGGPNAADDVIAALVAADP